MDTSNVFNRQIETTNAELNTTNLQGDVPFVVETASGLAG
jgi:hypothetical protein